MRTHGGTTQSRPHPPRPVVDRTRVYDATPRQRSHGARPAARPVPGRNAVKRRRANVLFVLALLAGCSLFLAATTKVEALLWFSCAVFAILCCYVYVLGQLRQREEPPAPLPVAHQLPDHAVHRRSQVHRDDRSAPARRAVAGSQRIDRWSHAV